MPLLTLDSVDLSVGGPRPLLEGVDLAVERGERICVVGRNGVGKSTLLKLLAGAVEPDDGRVRSERDLRVATLAQEVPEGTHGPVFDVVAQAVGDVGAALAEFHRLSQAAEGAEDIEALGRVQARIDAAGGWDLDRRVSEVITRLGLQPEARFEHLSGGMKRRVLLARALAGDPDLLLLDEPTNHLDIDNIRWLEEFLGSFPGAVVFVTHDRGFLRAVATRIVEIDRAALVSYPGHYDDYLRRRDERLHAEAQEQARFDRRLAAEEAWIRQGIKARRKRNMGRVRALEEMRRQRAARREGPGRVRLEAAEASGSGRRVIEAEDLSFAWADGHPVVRGLSTTILRGDRVGLVGPNGSGKTTLIRLLLGDLEPTAGHVRIGSNLQVAYFDQQRAALDERATALENVAGGRESITVNGRSRHVMSYLQDFLFSPERARAPITRLSGGERNRLLLARLFSQPSNVLVLDEPTNDLDIETLELLEELVAEYRGTVLLVSHDRAFLDNVVTSLLVLEGNGRVREHVGSCSEWLERVAAERAEARAAAPREKAPRRRPAEPAAARRLNPREREELAALPERIEALEQRVAELTEQLAGPALYQGGDPSGVNEQLAAVQAELDQAFERWAELDARDA